MERWVTIEDCLARHSDFSGRGGWFGFTDSKNKTYDTLVIHDDKYEKPTESWIKQEIEKNNKSFIDTQYQRDRLTEYPSIQECIHAILDDDLEALQAKRNVVKAKYPKPE
tara:strand:+ start:1078 stop:1407 length:330 start_codon:yes stop_codon:yes gene_type:complete